MAGAVARRGLARLGYRVLPLDDEATKVADYDLSPHDPTSYVPADAVAYLRRDNPRLLELRQAYEALDWPVLVKSRWATAMDATWFDLRYFRGESPYVWHYRESHRITRFKYFVLLEYHRANDANSLLERLGEDGAFGAFRFTYPGRPVVSRDLLDSTNELSFLDETLDVLSWEGLRVLDIGAGYGRLAHRMHQAAPGLGSYTCVDAVPESTFVCEYYARYRALEHAKVVALDHVPTMPRRGFDLAVNVHSFSECPLVAIEWWLDQLELHDVPNLFVVPNEPVGFLSTEPDGTRRDYLQAIRRRGYRLTADRPAYDDPAVRELIDVHDRFCLFVRDA